MIVVDRQIACVDPKQISQQVGKKSFGTAVAPLGIFPYGCRPTVGLPHALSLLQ